MWTVEWTSQDGTTVLDRVNENETIFTAYELKFKPKADRQKLWDAEKLKSNRHLRKRKAEDDGRRLADENVAHASPVIAHQLQAPNETTALPSQDQEAGDVMVQLSQTTAQVNASHVKSDEPPSSAAPLVKVEPATVTSRPAHTTPVPHFYLVKPMTGSKRVLIPFRHDESLAANLRGQCVFEFPTIQILLQGRRELPEPFALDKDFEKTQPRLIREVDEPSEQKLANQNRPQTTEVTAGPISDSDAADHAPSKVMEALQSDIALVKEHSLS